MNVSKTKELIADYARKQQRSYTPLQISGTAVRSFKYLSVHFTEDLTWTTHIDTMTAKARQRLYHFRQLRKFNISQRVLLSFVSAAVQSILTGSLTAWYGNSSSQDKMALQRIVPSAEHTTGTSLPSLQSLYNRSCVSRARRVKDPHHLCNGLFVWLLSGTATNRTLRD